MVGFYIELFLCGSEAQCDVSELTNRCCSNQEYIEGHTQDSALHLKQKYKNTNLCCSNEKIHRREQMMQASVYEYSDDVHCVFGLCIILYNALCRALGTVKCVVMCTV